MQLSEFVAETIRAIVAGIVNAQGAAAEAGAVVNPDGVIRSKGDDSPCLIGDARMIREVEFDVAVTAGDSEKSGVGGGVTLSVLSFGAKSESERRDSTVTRVRFSVPLVLPKPPRRKVTSADGAGLAPVPSPEPGEEETVR
jgi:hypothetical protein